MMKRMETMNRGETMSHAMKRKEMMDHRETRHKTRGV